MIARRRPGRASGERAGWWLAAVVLCFLAAAPASAAAISSRPDPTYVTDGPVYAVARSADKIYLGGRFDQVGPRTGPWVEISSATGQTNAALPQVTGGAGKIDAVVPDGSGGFYIAGDFTHVGGVVRNEVAHIRADGTVDPGWDPNANGEVFALVVSGSKVYLGGAFTTVNGATARSGAAAVDATTGAVTSWNPDVGGAVYTMALSGSTMYMGGLIFSVNGSTQRLFAAAVDVTTGVATAWNPDVNHNIAGGSVNALVVSGSTVYLGGSFGTVNGSTVRNNLAAVDATNGTDTAWNPNVNGPVYALAQSGSTLYVGGSFTTINGSTARSNVATVDESTGTAGTWNPDANGAVEALALSGSTVYLGGAFRGANSINGLQTRNDLAAVDASSGTATSWNPNANGNVLSVAPSGTTVAAGGSFSSLGGQTRHNAAALDGADGTLAAWDPDANNAVRAIAVSGSTVYLGGDFFKINGSIARIGAAAVDATTGGVTGWDPHLDGGVYALAVSGSTVYLGGYFTHTDSGFTQRNRAAAVDATTGASTGWNPDLDGTVWSLAVSGSTVYLGGSFATIDITRAPTPRNNAAAVDAVAGNPESWNPNVSDTVLALAVSGSTVYLGGSFHGAGSINTSVTRDYAAAVDATTAVATPWNAGVNGPVLALAPSGSSVFLAGGFTMINGSVPRADAAEVDQTTGSASGWDPLPSGNGFTRTQAIGYALAPDGGGGMILGGDFNTFDQDAQQGIASFSAPPASSASPAISGTPAVGQALSCSQGGWGGTVPQSYAWQWLRDGTAIAGATASGYTIAGTDAGHAISCQVTATNLAGSASAQSAAVAIPATAAGSAGSTSGTPGAPGVPGGGALAALPVLSRLTISPAAIVAAPRGGSIARARRIGATVSYTDTQAATTTFTVWRSQPGVRQGKRCVKPPKRRKGRVRKCVLYVRVGSFSRSDAAGRNRFHFTGRVNRRKLARARYRLDATPRSHGRTGRTVSATFRIVG